MHWHMLNLQSTQPSMRAPTKQPLEMAYGTNVALPVDHALHMHTPELDAAALDFLSHIQHTISEAKAALEKAYEHQKTY